MKRLIDDENGFQPFILSIIEGSLLDTCSPDDEELPDDPDNITRLPVSESALEYRDEERY